MILRQLFSIFAANLHVSRICLISCGDLISGDELPSAELGGVNW